MSNRNRMGATMLIAYEGGIKGENPVDIRKEDNPLRIVLGAGQIPVGMERPLFDLEVGAEVVVDMTEEDGYGPRDEKRCNWYPRTLIPHGYQLKVGNVIRHTNKKGIVSPVWVVEADDDVVKLDFNHPFAGHELRYRIKLVDIIDPSTM